jgi:hypothetical protein
MTLILTETTKTTIDPVEAAVRAFVEAAQASETGYTVEQLKEMVETVALSEAGGLYSWLARAYTGQDADIVSEMKGELEKITTQDQKDEALEMCDKLIKQAKGVTAGQVVYHLLAPTGWFGIAAAIIFRAIKKGDGSASEYRTALTKLRAEIAAKKVSK